MPPVHNNNFLEEISALEKKVESVVLPPELKDKTTQLIYRLSRLTKGGEYFSEYEKISQYLDLIVNLPWDKRTDDTLDIEKVKEILDKNHYGLDQVKERILEYIAVLKLRGYGQKNPSPAVHAPVLCFVGLVGTGKTTIAHSIAQAMGRKFARIPFGGMGDPLDLRGQSRLRLDAEPGLIIKAIMRSGAKNPVILLDEVDRTTDEGRSSIMGVLVELLDPEQNQSFRDHYVDYPFDLSEVLFVVTANNSTNISVAVMDRLEPIQMPSYSDEEKIKIGKDYILPKTIAETGLSSESIIIDTSVWPRIVRPLGYDAGIRTLERMIEGICRKVAKQIVEGQGKSFRVTPDNIKEFLPVW